MPPPSSQITISAHLRGTVPAKEATPMSQVCAASVNMPPELNHRRRQANIVEDDRLRCTCAIVLYISFLKNRQILFCRAAVPTRRGRCDNIDDREDNEKQQKISTGEASCHSTEKCAHGIARDIAIIPLLRFTCLLRPQHDNLNLTLQELQVT